MRVRRVLARGLVAIGVVGLAAGAGDEDRDATAQANRAVAAKLKEPIPLSLKDIPLADALDDVRAATAGPNDRGIRIEIDHGALNRYGVSLETRVSIESK